MANKRHIRLNSARDVHKLLSKLINERRRGQVDTPECRDIGFLAKILLDSIEAGELENRIENLEKPQAVELKVLQHSEADEKVIIEHYRRIELGLPHPGKRDTEGEIVELIPDEPDKLK